MLDHFTVQQMDALCIKMLESATMNREQVVLDTMTKLREIKTRGEKWGENPSIPFSMNSMDERDLDERIADNKRVLALIERRIASLKVWLD